MHLQRAQVQWWYWIKRRWQSLDGRNGKGFDGLYEKASFQTALEGVQSGWKSD